MKQLELFPICDDHKIKNLMKAITLSEGWSPCCSLDKLEEAGRIHHVLCQTVVKCFEKVIENECSVNSTSS